MIKSPQDVCGCISAEAKVQRFARFVELLPGWLKVFVRRIGLVVIIGDGIANQQKLSFRMSMDSLKYSLMPFQPPGLASTISRNNRRICSRLRLCHHGESKSNHEHGHHGFAK